MPKKDENDEIKVFGKKINPNSKPKNREFSIMGHKYLVDPSAKGGVRKSDHKNQSKRAIKMIQDKNNNFGKGSQNTPCKSNPKCIENHDSIEEAEFCLALSKKFENKPKNWHFRLLDGKIIDLFFENKIFIEYHPIIPTRESKEEYINKRRTALNDNNYENYPLFVVLSLKNKKKTVEKINDKILIFYDLLPLFNELKKYYV